MNAIALQQASSSFDVEKIREDFPILSRELYGKPLVYLDSAASAQKPWRVIKAMERVQTHCYSNVHRGIHSLSQTATDHFERAREKVARFINAPCAAQCVFTRGATESINIVAQSYGRSFLREGDEILVTEMEHHANIVPWQFLVQEKGIKLVVAPIDDQGDLILEVFEKRLSERTKLVAFTHISNALGTVNPAVELIRMARKVGAKVLIDGCQAAPHATIDVQQLDADFYVFSGHKVYGPTGIGVLYGKADLLESMPPYQGGGEMIDVVTFEKSTFKGIPYRFEAGTPAIIEAVGLGAALDYVDEIGRDAITAHESDLLTYANEALSSINSLRIIGQAKDKASILSFVMDNAHPHDIGTILDRRGVAVRVGHHCAQPLMRRLNVPATARASLALYNTRHEVDAFVDGLAKVEALLG